MQLERIKELVAADLDRVEATIEESLASESEAVRNLVDHVSHFSGKRLRPVLILLAARALDRVTEDHVKLGAVIELIHTATLVHDDILDGASMRRRVESVNSLHGDHVSVLLGDMIYARAFKLSLTLADNRAAETLAWVTQTICQGEIEQVFHRNDFDLSEEAYFEIIGAKTASLYKASCELAAHYAGAPEETGAALGRFGYDLGTAFQIVDDCLDLVGDESVVGKSLGTDLERGKMTLPVIHLSAALTVPERERLREVFLSEETSGKSRIVMERFDLRSSVDHAVQVAERYVESGLSELECLPASLARDALASAGEFVLVRKV